MAKVVLPVKVANAIEELRGCVWSNADLLEVIGDPDAGEGGETSVIVRWIDRSKENVTTYARAVLDGYEVEKSAKERLRDVIREAQSERLDMSTGAVFARIIRLAAEAAGEEKHENAALAQAANSESTI